MNAENVDYIHMYKYNVGINAAVYAKRLSLWGRKIILRVVLPFPLVTQPLQSMHFIHS